MYVAKTKVLISCMVSTPLFLYIQRDFLMTWLIFGEALYWEAIYIHIHV